jgi:hypothetical protein
MPDPTQTSAPDTPWISGALKRRIVFIAIFGFLLLLQYSTNEILNTVLGVAVLIGLIYYLASGQAAGDPTSIYPMDDVSRLFTRQRTHFIPPDWLPTHAIIASVDQHSSNSGNSISFSFSTAALVQMQPDLVYVSFQYKVAGELYKNGFIVACDKQDRFFEEIAAKAAGTESIAIHFDLANPSEAIPTDATWHGWPIRYFRITKP